MAHIPQIPYTYKNCPIPGGGFVPEVFYHPENADIAYARTDIGGIYRLNIKDGIWKSLVDSVTEEDMAQAYPLALTMVEHKPEWIYSVCGDRKNGFFCISRDYGENWIQKELPVNVFGNNPGRSTGSRLLQDGKRIFFASQTGGLLVTEDEGDSWTRCDVCEEGDIPEKNLTFIHKMGEGKYLVGCSGGSNPAGENVRGCTLYGTVDDCAHFKKIPVPKPVIAEGKCDVFGYVPQRICQDKTYVYITFLCIGRTFYPCFDSYSGDTGAPYDGCVWRYSFNNQGDFIEYTDITPGKRPAGHGFGGCTVQDDMLLCTSIGKEGSDTIWCSFNHGDDFTMILSGTKVGKYQVKTPYMKTKYNGNNTMIHWMSDIKINPHNPNYAMITTGTGVFATSNLQDVRQNNPVCFYDYCNGIEETVHLHVVAIPEGAVRVLDLVGDLGGFAFTDLAQPCENSFANGNGDRYITCFNGDFANDNPSTVVATPRGNWTGTTKGGVIISKDGCKSWKLLSQPYGLSEKIDKALSHMQEPNVDSGWVSISCDGSRIIWSIREENGYLSDMTVYTHDQGKHWATSSFYDLKGNPLTEPLYVKIVGDRMDPHVFYAVGQRKRLFVSCDKGSTFKEYDFSYIREEFFADNPFLRVDVRASKVKTGMIYIALKHRFLLSVQYDKLADKIKTNVILSEGDYASAVGLAIMPDGSQREALYIAGCVHGKYGFYSSEDGGKSWLRLNTDKQCYGQINSIDGDDREYGRFYIATGTRGILYGEPSSNS